MAEAVVLGRFCPLQRRRTASSLRAIGRRKTPVLRTGYGEAIQSTEGTVRRPRSLDCFVAPLLAMTIRPEHARPSEMLLRADAFRGPGRGRPSQARTDLKANKSNFPFICFRQLAFIGRDFALRLWTALKARRRNPRPCSRTSSSAAPGRARTGG